MNSPNPFSRTPRVSAFDRPRDCAMPAQSDKLNFLQGVSALTATRTTGSAVRISDTLGRRATSTRNQ